MAANNPRQQALDERLSQILQQSDLPSLAENIQELMLRSQDDEVTLRQVTNIILKDVGLSLRVLRTANSSRYNRSGRPILTVGHAVALIGLEAILDLAATLLLLRHFRYGGGAVRHLLALSLLTANHARSAAVHTGYERCEEAYLCGMFRNLGEVLVACYFAKDYAAILEQMKQPRCTERSACVKILNFTYEDLGQAALLRWQMPDRVANSMRAGIPPKSALRKEGKMLQELSGFSHELTGALHRESPDGLRARMNRILDTHGPLLNLHRSDLESIAAEAIEETKSTFEMLRIPLDDLRLRKQMERAIEALNSTGELEVAEQESLLRQPPSESLLRQLTQEVESVTQNGQCDLNQVLMMVLEAIQRGAGFSRVLFCLVSNDHKVVQARLGLGDQVEELIEKFQFPLTRGGGPLTVAMIGRRDLLVEDGPYLHTPFAQALGCACFGLYPLIVQDVVAGCLYFDAAAAPASGLGKPLAEALSRLRDLSEKAILSKRLGR